MAEAWDKLCMLLVSNESGPGFFAIRHVLEGVVEVVKPIVEPFLADRHSQVLRGVFFPVLVHGILLGAVAIVSPVEEEDADEESSSGHCS